MLITDRRDQTKNHHKRKKKMNTTINTLTTEIIQGLTVNGYKVTNKNYPYINLIKKISVKDKGHIKKAAKIGAIAGVTGLRLSTSSVMSTYHAEEILVTLEIVTDIKIHFTMRSTGNTFTFVIEENDIELVSFLRSFHEDFEGSLIAFIMDREEQELKDRFKEGQTKTVSIKAKIAWLFIIGFYAFAAPQAFPAVIAAFIGYIVYVKTGCVFVQIWCHKLFHLTKKEILKELVEPWQQQQNKHGKKKK